ncbi:MAG TPA: orotidine-5'-phosphate decarboxylase [Candidatus Paceibacterota bacterium]|nr:orotidine-5'-phosphate decarboxylase [Candidatus Paceibacterota bacterium]
MTGRNFRDLLDAQWDKEKFLCVGLDPDLSKIPEALRKAGAKETIVAFNRAIIDATGDIACAFKPNSAFYEAHGEEGYAALRETVEYSLERAPGTAIILDAKRADIGNTNIGYAVAAFDHLKADALTVQPYAGFAALKPLFERPEKGVLVWCRSSNEGAGEFQDLEIEGAPLYVHVARHCADEWNENGNCGLVVGATYPEEIANVRAAAAELPFLIPGTGAQGGDLGKSVAAAKDSNGAGFVLSVSRAILYASSGPDFAEAAGKAARGFHDAIKRAL